ncbi:receptor-type tyrosine-protein phosphatase alpha-like [Haliotis cracherodii]|uniref:receptor-type tyrosine-protein phosphatase alpha-like n=1 Tax=Haliotis cracherodii TaxID=6455 RepID=UPI0039ECAA83
MRVAKSPTAMMKTRLFILHISFLCIADTSSVAEMKSPVTSSMTSSEGSIALSAGEKTSLAGQSMETLADIAHPESITAASVTAESADDTKIPTSASMVPLITSASLASSTLRTLPVTDSQSEQTFTDALSQSSPSVPRSDFMSNSQTPTPEIMTSTTPPPPAAFSTKDETSAPRTTTSSSPSAATLSTPVLTANVATGDITAALSTSNTFITSESTLSTAVPTANVSTGDLTAALSTSNTFITSESTLSTAVPIAIINSSLSAAITPLSASLATFTITAVLTSESIPLLSGSTLKSTEFAQPSAISSPITAQPAPTQSTHMASVSTSTFTISTLMTPQQVTQEHQDSTEGSIGHTRMSGSAESSTSAVTSTATDMKSEQTISLASTSGSLQMPASSSLVPSATWPSLEPSATSAPEVSSTTSLSTVPSSTWPSLEPSETSAPEVSSTTSLSLVPSATWPSLEPSATSAPEVSSTTSLSTVPSSTWPSLEPSETSAPEVSSTTSLSLVPSATWPSLEPSATSAPEVSSTTSLSTVPSSTWPSLEPSATSTSEVPFTTSASQETSATSTSLVPSATSTLLVPSVTSISFVPSATSPSLMPSATSTSRVPSATSTLLVPSTTSPSVEPLATSTLLVSSATSTSLMSSATSTSLVSSATSTSSPTSDRQSEQTFTDTVPPESLTEIYVTTSTPATTSMPHITSTAPSLTTVNSISSSVSPTTSTATSHLFTPSTSALSSPVLTPTSTSISSVQSTSLLSSTSQPSSTASVTTDSTSLPASPITPPLSTHTSVPTSVTPASPSDQTGSGDTGIVVGVSIGVVLLLAVVVCVLVVVKLRVMKKRPLYGRMVGSKEIRRSSETSIEMTSVSTAVDNYENFQPGDIEISGLAEYIARKMQNNELDEEYKALPSTPIEVTDEHVGQLACNKEKNRFADIFAYDCSRVVLQRGDATETDYINANFITGYGDKKRAYIAAQGPNARSLADFWLMIWQQDVRCVVMLTNLRENNRRKCEKYWPDEGSRDSYGDVDVSCTHEDVTSTYVVRVLQAGHHTKTTETRRIVQYHFTTWPDHGVPSAPSLVEFWQQVKEHKSTIRPLVVHCSAGVGRTGTFIGLDALMERCKVESTVNVFRRVSSMRGERMSTVQTRRQYTFLHLVLLEALYSEGTHRLCEELVAGTRCEEDHIYKEFQMLQELRNLNRNLAAPNHAEGDDVSNIPSYTSDVEFLLTSSSQPATAANHLWSMVDHYKATIILAICDEVATGIIPSPIGESLLDDSLLLTLKSSSFISEHVRETEIVAEPDDDTHSEDVAKPWKVTLLSTPSVTASVSEVITLVELLENTRHLATESIVVYSCPDSHPATLLCIIWNIIQRLQRHPGVDIFLIVREMQSIKPSYHISQDDYRFLYTLASEYITSTSIYANAYV